MNATYCLKWFEKVLKQLHQKSVIAIDWPQYTMVDPNTKNPTMEMGLQDEIIQWTVKRRGTFCHHCWS